jgi:hypothetical protein
MKCKNTHNTESTFEQALHRRLSLKQNYRKFKIFEAHLFKERERFYNNKTNLKY